MALSFVDRVKLLNLPLEDIIVIGSGVMDALGIRSSGDVDLVVRKELFAALQDSGEWQKDMVHDEPVLRRDDVEVWLSWSNSGEPNFDELLANAVAIDGVWFVSPQFLLEWKKAKRRPKDIQDVALLEEYLQNE